MADGPSNGGRLPWVDQATRVVTQVGFPVVVAAALLWWILFRFEVVLEKTTMRMEQNGRAVNELAASIREANAISRQWATDNVSELRRQTDELRTQTDAMRKFVDTMLEPPRVKAR